MDGIRLLMLLSSSLLLLLLNFCNDSFFECCGDDDIAGRPSGLTVDGQNAETHFMWSIITITATASSRGQRLCFDLAMVIMMLLCSLTLLWSYL